MGKVLEELLFLNNYRIQIGRFKKEISVKKKMFSQANYAQVQQQALDADRILSRYILSQPHKTAVIEMAGNTSTVALENLARTLYHSDQIGKNDKHRRTISAYGPRLPKYAQGTRRASRGPRI